MAGGLSLPAPGIRLGDRNSGNDLVGLFADRKTWMAKLTIKKKHIGEAICLVGLIAGIGAIAQRAQLNGQQMRRQPAHRGVSGIAGQLTVLDPNVPIGHYIPDGTVFQVRGKVRGKAYNYDAVFEDGVLVEIIAVAPTLPEEIEGYDPNIVH